jgi:hypothetical protein
MRQKFQASGQRHCIVAEPGISRPNGKFRAGIPVSKQILGFLRVQSIKRLEGLLNGFCQWEVDL